MKATALSILLFLLCLSAIAQTYQINKSIPHLEKQGTATRLIVNDQPFLMLGGELHNSSTSNANYMQPIWKKMAQKQLNTVIAGVSWELVEPQQGKFDFTLADSMILGARKQGLHLVLIWFGSWKNGSSTYAPAWIKQNYDKYLYVKNKSGKSLEILSTFGKATMEADANAFGKLMAHIKQVDAVQQTVIMMQVENEVGVLNSSRDFNTLAQNAFNDQIPPDLSAYLANGQHKLAPELYAIWKENGAKTNGTWQDVFGKGKLYDKDWKALSYYTDELFMAYHYAKYIGAVAAAGKKAYAIPIFVNAWQKQEDYFYPGKYPSGGPLPQVIDMWRCAGPAIDIIVPDIYVSDFTSICEQYHRLGNPLLIPETRGGAIGAARSFYAFGQYDAMCFSPFGIDGDYLKDDHLTDAYSVLSQLKKLILSNQGLGSMKGILVDTVNTTNQITLGGYHIEARLANRNKNSVAGGIIINIAPNEFIIAGKSLDMFFTPATNDGLPLVAIEYAEEVSYKKGKWLTGRRLNGDEIHTSTFDGTGLIFPSSGYSIQHVKLYRYK